MGNADLLAEWGGLKKGIGLRLTSSLTPAWMCPLHTCQRSTPCNLLSFHLPQPPTVKTGAVNIRSDEELKSEEVLASYDASAAREVSDGQELQEGAAGKSRWLHSWQHVGFGVSESMCWNALA